MGLLVRLVPLPLPKMSRNSFNADIGISFTGVAGPSKSENKEVGTVYIGLSTQNETYMLYHLNLVEHREAIRHRTVLHGL